MFLYIPNIEFHFFSITLNGNFRTYHPRSEVRQFSISTDRGVTIDRKALSFLFS